MFIFRPPSAQVFCAGCWRDGCEGVPAAPLAVPWQSRWGNSCCCHLLVCQPRPRAKLFNFAPWKVRGKGRALPYLHLPDKKTENEYKRGCAFCWSPLGWILALLLHRVFKEPTGKMASCDWKVHWGCSELGVALGSLFSLSPTLLSL